MRYPGGKGKCYQQLINLMPAHTTYIESHLGGGAVLRHKRRAHLSIGIDSDERVIERWRQEYPNFCALVHGDAVTFLKQYAFTGDELLYSDPPYLTHTRSRAKIYRDEYSIEDHEELLETVQKLPCKVMISGYDNSLYRQVLSSWRTATFDAKTHAGVREECVWMNFEATCVLHDASHLGASFRERQTIGRRHSRLIERVSRMAPVERHHLLRTLNERYAGEGVSE